MFERASKRGHPQESKSQIITTYLGRVKNLISSLKSQTKLEALGKKARPEGPRKLEPRDRGDKSPQRSLPAKNIDPKKVDWKNTPDDDILSNNKVAMKRL